MSSPPLYTDVSSDNVIYTLNGEGDFSNSASPAVTDVYNPNVHPNENYVPWFINTHNLWTNTSFEPEPMSSFSTSFEGPEWDCREAQSFQSTTRCTIIPGNTGPWSNNFPQQSFTSSPEDATNFMEGGKYFSSLIGSSRQQSLVMPVTRTFKQETHTQSKDKSPSPKRRKSSTTSSSSPTEDYRKGHNAIEKRYRSNLNSKILSLERSLPVQEITEDENEVGPARKTKSAILTRAVKHIELLKQNTRRLTLEMEELNWKFSELEKKN